MLEKNKDYFEMCVSCTDFAFTQNEPVHLCVEGLVDAANGRFPGPGEDYILISKEKFDRLQANVGINEELAKQWEINYNLLLKKIGFDTVEELVDYLYSEAKCDTLHEVISKLHDKVEYANDKWANTVLKLEECEKDYISERDKAEALEKENEQLRNERTHIVYLNDPLGVISKWEKVTGYDRPEDFLKWKANIEGIMEAWKDATGCKYPGDAMRLLEKWKTLTKCETPEAAATWITSYESACERGNRLAESVKNLKEEIVSWKSVTGYSTPEDYLAAVIKNTAKTVLSWQEITGFSTPEKCSSYIDTLEQKLEDIKDLIEED